MSRFPLLLFALLLAGLSAGCGANKDSLDACMTDSLGYQNEASAALEDITQPEFKDEAANTLAQLKKAAEARELFAQLKKKAAAVDTRAKAITKDMKPADVLELQAAVMSKQGEKIKEADRRYRKAYSDLTKEAREALKDVVFPPKVQ